MNNEDFFAVLDEALLIINGEVKVSESWASDLENDYE